MFHFTPTPKNSTYKFQNHDCEYVVWGFTKTAKIMIFAVFVVLAFAFVSSGVFAQTAAEGEKKMLKKELEGVTKEIEEYEGLIREKSKERKSLSRDVYILNQQIKERGLEVRQSQLAVQDIESQIQLKTQLIIDMDDRIKNEKKLLAEYIRQMYEYDTVTLFELFFMEKSMSGFFFKVKATQDLQIKIGDLTNEVRGLKKELENEKDYLEQDKAETLQLKAIGEYKKRAVEQTKRKKNVLLSKTKGQEKAYQTLLKKSQKTAAQIRSKLYLLEGGGDAITFGQALDTAEFVESKTGVRPAFLLALLQKESSKTKGIWGDYLGTGNWKTDMYDCYVANRKTTKARKLKNAFLDITSRLGIDPNTTIVSRSDRRNHIFCGGAMGPAQFMPTTWLAYEARITKLTGRNPPNPWIVQDAFMASGLYLYDKGAANRTYNAEYTAAARYYGGKYAGRIYARDVMRRAATIQEEINILKRSK